MPHLQKNRLNREWNGMGYIDEVMESLRQKNSQEPEFLQAVGEVLESVAPLLAGDAAYQRQAILERLTEPERVDDQVRRWDRH